MAQPQCLLFLKALHIGDGQHVVDRLLNEMQSHANRLCIVSSLFARSHHYRDVARRLLSLPWICGFEFNFRGEPSKVFLSKAMGEMRSLKYRAATEMVSLESCWRLPMPACPLTKIFQCFTAVSSSVPSTPK